MLPLVAAISGAFTGMSDLSNIGLSAAVFVAAHGSPIAMSGSAFCCSLYSSSCGDTSSATGSAFSFEVSSALFWLINSLYAFSASSDDTSVTDVSSSLVLLFSSVRTDSLTASSPSLLKMLSISKETVSLKPDF